MVLYEGGTTTERMVLYEGGLLQKGWSYMREGLLQKGWSYMREGLLQNGWSYKRGTTIPVFPFVVGSVILVQNLNRYAWMVYQLL